MVVVKQCCRCGASYDATAWAALPCIGLQSQGEDYPPMELRQCPCDNTLNKELDAKQPLPAPPRVPVFALETLPPPPAATAIRLAS